MLDMDLVDIHDGQVPYINTSARVDSLPVNEKVTFGQSACILRKKLSI
jgi:hypothetical protein